MSTYLPPLVADVSARFEAKSGYFISPGIQRKFDELSGDYKEFAWFCGHYGGRPRIFTDSKGMGTGSRIEVGRAVFISGLLGEKMEDVFRLFRKAEERELTSGGITSIRIIFNRKRNVEQCLYSIKRAFGSVLGDTFGEPHPSSPAPERSEEPIPEQETRHPSEHRGSSSHTQREEAASSGPEVKDSAAGASPRDSWECVFYNAHSYYELGMVLVHQPLVDHLFNTGPYNVKNKPLLEDIQKELESEEGSYEGISVFALVDKNPGAKRDTINLAYTSDGRKEELERKMEDKCGVLPRFLEDPNKVGESEEIVTLQIYGSAIRQYGSLWMLKPSVSSGQSTSDNQDESPGIVLTLSRKYVPLLYLFFDDRYMADTETPDTLDAVGAQHCYNPISEESIARVEIPRKTQTWDQLYEKLSNSRKVSKSHSESPTYLDSGLRRLENMDLIERKKYEWKLADDFAEWKHVTYYSLDDYRRAMSELRVDAAS